MNRYELWFIAIKISNYSKIRLLERYKCEENIYKNIENIEITSLLKGKEYTRLKELSLDDSENLLQRLVEGKIQYVTINHKQYPESLRNIEEPPYVLFYRGNLELLEKNLVAVVGSRKCSVYGVAVTKAIVSELVKMDYAVVSGVADGIDTVSHQETLNNSGLTVGVLGCGIDVVYPYSNRRLYKEIAERGLLISEFEPGTKPMPYNFPRRNRIISGLSKGVIVTEASVKSGSMITVDFALDQGKDVMAVPGSVLTENSSGCNKLLLDGAVFFTHMDDLYIFLKEVRNIKKNNIKNPIKNSILNVVNNEPTHIDKIISGVNIDRSTLFELLFEMQNRNEIICLPGNYYARLN